VSGNITPISRRFPGRCGRLYDRPPPKRLFVTSAISTLSPTPYGCRARRDQPRSVWRDTMNGYCVGKRRGMVGTRIYITVARRIPKCRDGSGPLNPSGRPPCSPVSVKAAAGGAHPPIRPVGVIASIGSLSVLRGQQRYKVLTSPLAPINGYRRRKTKTGAPAFHPYARNHLSGVTYAVAVRGRPERPTQLGFIECRGAYNAPPSSGSPGPVANDTLGWRQTSADRSAGSKAARR